MTELEIHNEIFHILEVDIMNRQLSSSQLRAYNVRLRELLDIYPEGEAKNKDIAKLRDKQRFCYYINNTGILDFTGYGKNFW